MNQSFGRDSKKNIIREESSCWKDMINNHTKGDPTGVTYQYMMFLREAYLDMLCNTLEKLNIDTPIKEKKIEMLIQTQYNKAMQDIFKGIAAFNQVAAEVSVEH